MSSTARQRKRYASKPTTALLLSIACLYLTQQDALHWIEIEVGEIHRLDVSECMRPGTHHIRLIDDNTDALMTRLQLIAEAEKRIDMCCYIWRDDGSGRAVFAELLAAAERGVQIRLLGDGVFFLRDAPVVKAMARAHPDLALRYYNVLDHQVASLGPGAVVDDTLFDFGAFNHRLHIKLLIVDNEAVVLGGRNVGDAYFGRSNKLNFVDRDLLIRGPAVSDTAECFEQYWQARYSADPATLRDTTDLEVAKIDWPSYRLSIDRNAIGDETFTVDQLGIVADQIPRDMTDPVPHQSSRTARALADLFLRCQQHLRVETPYLILSDHMRRVFDRLIDTDEKERPELSFWTNSLASLASWHSHVGFLQQAPSFIETYRFDIRQHRPDRLRSIAGPAPATTCMHSKTYLIDDHYAAIGSYNLDPRSGRWNAEILAICVDQSFVEALNRQFDRRASRRHNWVLGRDASGAVSSALDSFVDESLGNPDTGITTMLLDLQNLSCFTFEGEEAVAPSSPDFAKHYRPVGLFPEVPPTDQRRLFTMLLTPIGDWLAPIL